MKRLPLWISAGILATAGICLALFKILVLGFPVRPAEDAEIWTVQARFTIDGYTRPVKAVLQIPAEPPGFTLLDENFVSRGFGFSLEEKNGRREAQWSIREASGRQTFYYRVTATPERRQRSDMPSPLRMEETRLEEPFETARATVAASAQRQSADVTSFTAELLGRLNDPDPDENVALLLSQGRSPGRKAELAVELLAAGSVSARVAYGVELEDGERYAPFVPTLEVWTGTEWEWFDPASGERGRPDNLLIWWRGTRPLIDVVGGFNPEVQISSWRNVVGALQVAEQRADLVGSSIMDYSLLRLPVQVQSVYRVLLLIPVGALIMVVFRNVIGIKTVGTFLPVLVALAFRETRLLAGIFLFVLVVAIGMVLRFLLDRLLLLMVPRLAAILVIVVLCLLTISILSHRLGEETGLSVALFPIVILTIAIERLSIVWEEVGAKEAVVQGLGTLVVAAVSYSVMGLAIVEYLVFVFPELLLVVLAAILLLGRYMGYRLLELQRFQQLAGGDA